MLMLLLTFGTDVLDTTTHLGRHGVFTATKTGNVIVIGLGVAGPDRTLLLRSALALALAGFLVGAAVVCWRQRLAQR